MPDIFKTFDIRQISGYFQYPVSDRILKMAGYPAQPYSGPGGEHCTCTKNYNYVLYFISLKLWRLLNILDWVVQTRSVQTFLPINLIYRRARIINLFSLFDLFLSRKERGEWAVYDTSSQSF